jgi:molybdopterin synthase catalytic subunit
MRIEVKLFAGLREAAGAGEVTVELEDGASAAGLLEQLKQSPGLGEVLTAMPVRVAVNRAYVDGEARLSDGDEVALVPPISGGAQVSAKVSEAPLDVAAVVDAAGDPAAGAVVVFQGNTREVARLDYEAYGEMAEQRIGEILTDCVEAHGLTAAVAEHRTGPVPLGEASVLVAVSAPHRPEAFAGAREAIDRIKAEAPIWKVEVEADGSRSRVEGTMPEVDGGRAGGTMPSADDGRDAESVPEVGQE